MNATILKETPIGGCLERLVRQIECPKCGTQLRDQGEKDELGCTWFADCQCGWWRELYMPNEQAEPRPGKQPKL